YDSAQGKAVSLFIVWSDAPASWDVALKIAAPFDSAQGSAMAIFVLEGTALTVWVIGIRPAFQPGLNGHLESKISHRPCQAVRHFGPNCPKSGLS
ncbi:hypothetical protein C8B47_25515, partial [filamentous cyanobacterium CCP4]